MGFNTRVNAHPQPGSPPAGQARLHGPPLGRGRQRYRQAVIAALSQESLGGLLLVVAAAVALGWANCGWSAGYEALRSWQVGPSMLHLHLSVAQWAADGLLAVFFFVAGLELKRECVQGDLRHPRRAVLPVAAAAAGMAAPVLLYVAVVSSSPQAHTLGAGWAIPTPTDIAFALAVLALVGRHLPPQLRTFLLAVAVVDDVLAITIIAVFYTDHLNWWPLVGCLPAAALFAWLARRPVARWQVLVPVAVLVWALMHASGVHATVAGVLLAVVVPVAARGAGSHQGNSASWQPALGRAQRWEHWWRPVSAGVVVPVFAFTSAGVAVGGLEHAAQARVTLAVLAGLAVGKPLGIIAAALLTCMITRTRLPGFGLLELFGVAVLAGMGFTVSLLLAQLSFPDHPQLLTEAKLGVVAGSVVAGTLGAALLSWRNRAYRRAQLGPGQPGLATGA